jgi:hypothetical protein
MFRTYLQRSKLAMLRSRPGVKKKELTEAEIGRLLRAYPDTEVPLRDLAKRFGIQEKDVTAYAAAAGLTLRPMRGVKRA